MVIRKVARLACLAALVPLTGALASAFPSTSGVPPRPDDKTIVHVLNRLGFGPSPGDIARVRQIGLERYIDQQLQPGTGEDAGLAVRLAGLDTLRMSSRQLAETYFVPALLERRRTQQRAASAGSEPGSQREMRTPALRDLMQAQRRVFTDLTQQKILRAVYSERQLNEVMVDFWFNHFNVFAGKGQTRTYLTEYERETIRPNVLGKFRTLLGATAQSPAMLFYLDNWQSAAPEGAPTSAGDRRAPTGREAGRGGRTGMPRRRTMADLPATAQNRRPRGLNENYARELMELHTLGVDGGFTQKDVQEVARAFTGWTITNPRQGGGFQFESRMHDDGEKTVLGHRLEAGGGRRDAEEILDILAAHPSTARFIAAKLARRFVADDPPAPLVDRAAARFGETGGDIREVVRTIVTSPEFLSSASHRAKVKTPFEFVAASLRATAAEITDAMPLVQAMRDLGMPPYQCQPPTGYADRAEAWVNAGALLNRMSFAIALTTGRLRGVSPGATLGDTLVNEVLAGELTPSTRTTVAKASTPSQAMALLLGSPEFQTR